MITVYRVQNANGYGPYTPIIATDEGMKAVSDNPRWLVEDNHVEPFNDGFGVIYEGEVCAFSTVHSARKWFNKSLVDILSNDDNDDWFFAMYKVPYDKMRVGTHQVLAFADDMVYCDAVPVEMLYIED